MKINNSSASSTKLPFNKDNIISSSIYQTIKQCIDKIIPNYKNSKELEDAIIKSGKINVILLQKFHYIFEPYTTTFNNKTLTYWINKNGVIESGNYKDFVNSKNGNIK